jgi:hypothetical protein
MSWAQARQSPVEMMNVRRPATLSARRTGLRKASAVAVGLSCSILLMPSSALADDPTSEAVDLAIRKFNQAQFDALPPVDHLPSSGFEASSESPLVVTAVKSETELPRVKALEGLEAFQVATTTAVCDYFPTNSWSAGWSGVPATWRRNFLGSYDHHGFADLRSSSATGGSNFARYSAQIGHGIRVGSPGIRSVTVQFPWRYEGTYSLLSQFSVVPFQGFSRATVDTRFTVDLRQNDTSSALEVDRRRVSVGNGTPAEGLPIARNGFATRKVSTPQGAVIRSMWKIDSELSTDLAPFTNARAQFDFDSGSFGWFNGAPQRWVYELEPGFVIKSCG